MDQDSYGYRLGRSALDYLASFEALRARARVVADAFALLSITAARLGAVSTRNDSTCEGA